MSTILAVISILGGAIVWDYSLPVNDRAISMLLGGIILQLVLIQGTLVDRIKKEE